MSTSRQIRALGALMVRHWVRAPLPSQRAPGGGRSSALILRLLSAAVFAGIGWRYGNACEGRPLRATEWFALGLLGLAAAMGATAGSVTVRGIPGLLNAPLLDGLPLRERSRVVMILAQQVHAYVLGVAAVYAVAPGNGLTYAAAFGTAMVTTALLAGLAAVRALRLVLTPIAHARLFAPLVALNMASFMAMALAPSLDTLHLMGAVARVTAPVARAMREPARIAPGLACLAAVALLSSLSLAWVERVGYDRVHAVPTRRFAGSPSRELGLRVVERLLASREPGSRMAWISGAYSLAIVAALVYFDIHHPPRGRQVEGALMLVRATVCLATILSFATTLTRAARGAERDLAARPFLSSLPIAPSDLLAGKAGPMRKRAVALVLPLLALLLVPVPLHARVEVAWRVMAAIAAAWLAGGTVVAVAFLSAGAGTRVGAAGRASTLESALLFVPLLRVATAPSVWAAAVPLVCLALLGVEARRAALECARWQDDGESFERRPPVWRALLVFTAFQAVQALALQLLAVFPLSRGAALATAYALSATALLALTFHERRGGPPIAMRPRRVTDLALGAALGVASGAAGLGFVSLLRRLGTNVPTPPSGAGAVALASTIVIAAPFAEEMFFRGWLQDALAKQYPDRGRAFALMVTAFAFAAAHPPISFVPVLVLGLITGTLFVTTRGVSSGIVAHATHNLVVTLFACA